MASNCCIIKFNKVYCTKQENISINNNSYCYNHAKLLYNKHITIIQKYYRGYRARRYLNNIFYKLPNEIQCIIIDYINLTFYKQKQLNIISNIIKKKTFDLHNYNISNKMMSLEYLHNCYKLYNKYHEIIPISNLKHFYCLGDQILAFCDILLQQDTLITNDIFPLYHKIGLHDIELHTIINLMEIIYRFSNLYSNKYTIYSPNISYNNISFI
mgnify:FL=1|tara:strand:- start:70 stop:708 length:639 start_codon:yes stop_codon:yes gene_type:complete